MEFYTLEDNVLTLNYEPVNDLDKFIAAYLSLLTSDKKDLYIVLSSSIGTLNSTYVGAIMSAAIMANQLHKTLHLRCNQSAAQWIKFVGSPGEAINWIIEEEGGRF